MSFHGLWTNKILNPCTSHDLMPTLALTLSFETVRAVVVVPLSGDRFLPSQSRLRGIRKLADLAEMRSITREALCASDAASSERRMPASLRSCAQGCRCGAMWPPWML
jgi:hypothetical protein